MLSKKHKLPRIFISFIVCFISIQKSRCQTTLAATNPQTTVTPVDCSPPGYCKNGGVCIESVVCQCQPGFSGDVCENIGCINDPTYCKNGGECIDAACQCPMGFTGDMCEIIECSSGTCQNGGDCLTELTSDPSNVCICAPGFQGTFCEEVDPEGTCILNCEGGNCTSNHTCVCDPGFKGTYCQEQITCFDEPCQNGGTCVLLARRKRQVFLPPSSAGCSCRVPYTGSFCEIELPPCDIDCKNNGECLLHPETLNYYCACAINYYGDFCENAELCDEIGCNGMGTCVEGSCVCLEGRYGAFCELDICSTRPCENGGLCILPINEFFSEVFTPVTEFQCACAPGFRGPTCTGVIVECSRNEYLCASGECIPLSKKCDSVTYDCADNSDEPDGECNNNNECRDLLANLDLMTRECGELSTPFRSFIESESVSLINVWKFNSPPSDFPGASNIISQITINIEPYMGTDILKDGTLFVALISENDGIQTQVYSFEVLYQNDNGQTKFIKYLTDIYNMGFNGQYVSLSFLPDGSTDHTLLPYFKCEIINEEIIEEETSSCITLMTRMFVPECNFNNCIDRYGDWKQASYQKRDLNCGVFSIDSVVDSTYQPCLSPPFIASVSGSMDVGIEEVVYLYCVAYGEPTPAVKWLEVSETGEVINTSEPADGQIVFELPDVTSASRYVCLAANVANEVVSDDVVISLEDPVCSSLQNLSREFSVTNSVCFNETVKNILSNEGQFGGFTYIDEFTEGTVLYAVSFSSTNVDVGGGEMSFSSTSVEQIGPVVLSMYLVISDVITGVVIYSHVFEGIIIVDPNIESRNPINLSFDTPIKINSTSRYEFRLSTTDQSYQLNNQPLDVKYVTCASGTQGCQEFISNWNGLISDQIDAGCDDIDIQYTAAELCFGEFFGDPEVIRHPESQDNAIGITTLECNIENVEFYEWYKNSKRITSSGPTYSLQLQDGQDQGDYACLGFRSQDDKDASSNTATVLITGVSTFRVIARFQIAFERAYTDRESEKFKNFTRDLQTSLKSEISTPFELYINSIKSGSVITEMEMYFSDQAQNASAVSVMINDTLVALPEYETDPSSVIVTSISTCVGEDVTQDGILYSFSDTPLDATAESVQDCPLYSDQGTTFPLATRYCGGDFVSGAKWSTVMVLDCDIGTTSEQIQRINDVEVTEDNGEDVADALADVTNNTAGLDADSIETVSSILEDIVALEMPDESITLDVVEIIDNVIESGVLGTNQSMRETASSFVTSLERQLATVAAAGMNFTTVQPYVGVMTLSVSSDSLENGLVYVAFSDGDSVKENFEPNNVKTFFENIFPIDMVGASIALPPEIVSISQAQTGEDEFRVYFTVYQNSSLFISNKLSKESGQDFTRQVGSHVISASVEAVKIDGLVYPVKAAFLPHFETINNTECVFWDFSVDDGVGDWSSDGCVFNKTEDDRVICFCDHLTNFAILVDYYEPKDSPFQDVLTIISLIGCIVSIVCLAITIATYLYFKQFRSKRPQRILINLSFSLLLLYLVFAIGIEKTSSRNGCIAVAALIHYFGLASVFWMSIEAVNMYLMFVKVFYDDIEYFMLKVCAIGYGVPLIIVAICLGIDVDNYANENYCFIPSGNVRNFGFILVIGVLILFNSIVFILVMRKLTCGRKIAKTIDQSKREIVIKRLQNAIAVSVLLGLTWAFGFLAIDSDSSARDVFQTLFCIFNSLQGLFIFLLFCVRQKDIRDAWKGCCKEGDRASRVKYATDTSNKKVKDQSIPLTHDSTQNSNTQSSNTKSNV